MPTLVRKPVVVTHSQLDDDAATFAEECSTLLGYHALRREVTEQQAPHVVAEALQKLDIKPYSDKSVAKYKLRKRIIEGFKHPATLFVTIGVIAILSWTIGGPIAAGIGWYKGLSLFTIPAGFYILINLVTGIIAAIVFCAATANAKAYDIYWENRPINDYYGRIPEFALQTALDLKKECGTNVHFYIDELKVVERRRDPFLVARDPSSGEDFYVEVWNEPKFRK